MQNLKLNDPESIYDNLTRDPEHLGILRKMVDENPSSFSEYFEKDHLPEDEFCGHPFLDWLCRVAFKWCGCAAGNGARLMVLYKIMKIEKEKPDFRQREAAYSKIFCDNGVRCMTMDFFENFSLFSHGGSCYSSWIDYDGELVWRHLEKWAGDKGSELG